MSVEKMGKKDKFRQRAPFMLIEHYDVQKDESSKGAWQEALALVKTIGTEHIASFKLVVNFIRKDGKK